MGTCYLDDNQEAICGCSIGFVLSGETDCVGLFKLMNSIKIDMFEYGEFYTIIYFVSDQISLHLSFSLHSCLQSLFKFIISHFQNTKKVDDKRLKKLITLWKNCKK